MFNKYYQDELTYLRDLGREFATAYPAIAPMLAERGDPDVERLLEGVAFLTGKIRQKLDDELPEVIHSVAALLFPHYLRQIPAASVIEFTPLPNVVREKLTVARMAEVATELMKRNRLISEDVDWLVPHQANRRIIEATAERMKLRPERVMVTIHKYGNTTAATIPLCLWDYESRLKAGDRLILAAFGGGFTWGGAYLTWAYDGKKSQ